MLSMMLKKFPGKCYLICGGKKIMIVLPMQICGSPWGTRWGSFLTTHKPPESWTPKYSGPNDEPFSTADDLIGLGGI